MARILTLHPEGKKGINISRQKYDLMKSTILECLSKKQSTYTEIGAYAAGRLKGKLKGSINWYVEIVKLDLETRNMIERIPKTKPQLYRLK
ncbi:MAG: hypothetical protein HYX24_04900 [Candidatus Aenigmarchaeota archaeon]|nr:hypothetical protein [Candidatus Aenigmarchaeota archaeon]